MEVFTARPEGAVSREETVIYDLLEEKGISFTRAAHDAAHTMEECAVVEEALGGKICKNLFLCNRQKTDFYLLLMPGDKPFKTKDITKQIGSARLSFGTGEDMERLISCTPGSASVFGLLFDKEKAVRLLIDRDLEREEFFLCHPCHNTATVKMNSRDVFNTVIPATGHEPTFVELPRPMEEEV